MTALEPLATAADLSARGIPVDETDPDPTIAALLDAASAAVRDAAGSPISKVESTVTIAGEPSVRLDLPSRPVISVSAVSVDGVALTEGVDYVLRGDALWRLRGPWATRGAVPPQVEVTFEHGLPEVPADIVDLVCALVAGGLAAREDGYDQHRSLTYEAIDDYRRGFQQGDAGPVSPMELPARTRRWLRTRFGSGAAVVGSVR